ncbi:MAG: zinc finger BED domain-containing protein [Candidatus Saccharimonadales bacterium]
MSQSQQSDFTSSLYNSEIDNLDYLSPSNLHCFTPEPSNSQLISNSLHSEFRRPTLPPAIPSSLTHVGPDRRKAYVLYDKMSHNDWVEWWLQTDYGSKGNIRWDSTHQSAVWPHFDQVAHGTNGAPKVMCKRCGVILEHPSNLVSKDESKQQRQGTSTMAKHLKSAACQRASTGSKMDISRFLQKTVSIYTHLDLSLY